MAKSTVAICRLSVLLLVAYCEDPRRPAALSSLLIKKVCYKHDTVLP